MDNVFVKPRLIDGKPAIIPDPHAGGVLPAEGAFKPRNGFWLRRLLDGDVIEALPPPPPAPPKAVKPAPATKRAPDAGDGEI